MERFAIYLAFGIFSSASAQSPAIPPTTPGTLNGNAFLLMNVGGPALPALGYVAEKIDYLRGNAGFTYTSNTPVKVSDGSGNAAVYLTERVSFDDFFYEIPVPAGIYNVTTMHAESFFSANGKRSFSIEINNDLVRPALDIHAEVGKDVALNLVFQGISPVNGVIKIKFLKIRENPLLNAIKIVKTTTAFDLVKFPCSAAARPVFLNMNIAGPGSAESGYTAENTTLISGPKGEIHSTATPVQFVRGPGFFRADVKDVAFLTERFTRSKDLTYTILVPAGSYEIFTKHRESFFSTRGARVFSIEVNGFVSKAKFDMLTLGGRNVGHVLRHRVHLSKSGALTIKFLKVVENPLVNGILINGCSGPDPGFDILKLNAGGGAISGYDADKTDYLTGLSSIVRNTQTTSVPVGATNVGIYKSERFALGPVLAYKLPVPAGTYTVTTYHAEAFFKRARLRVFDIEINGKIVRAKLDVFALAGMNKAVVLSFKNISPVGGFITIKLLKGVENPMLNGLRISVA